MCTVYAASGSVTGRTWWDVIKPGNRMSIHCSLLHHFTDGAHPKLGFTVQHFSKLKHRTTFVLQ